MHCQGRSNHIRSLPHNREAENCNERVCLVCVCRISSELQIQSSPHFVCILPMAVAWSSSGGLVICYVLPVLRMTSYLLKAKVARRRRPAEAQCTRSLGLGYKFTYSIAGIFTCRCPVPGTMGRVPDNLGHVTRIMSSASKSGTM